MREWVPSEKADHDANPALHDALEEAAYAAWGREGMYHDLDHVDFKRRLAKRGFVVMPISLVREARDYLFDEGGGDYHALGDALNETAGGYLNG